MTDVGSKNIYSLLSEDEPTPVESKPVKPQSAGKPQSRPTTQQSAKSTKPNKDIRNKKPAVVKEGEFEEKPDHKHEAGRTQRYHKHQKPAHGRPFDRRSGSHPVKGGDKKEVAGTSWGDEVEAQLAAQAEGEVVEAVEGYTAC
jgi:hypothetical protein